MALSSLFSRRRSDAATELRPLQPRTNLLPSLAPTSALPSFQKALPQLSPVSSISAADQPYSIQPPAVLPPPGTPFTLPTPLTPPPLVANQATPPTSPTSAVSPISPLSPVTPTDVANAPLLPEITLDTPLGSNPTYIMPHFRIVGMAGRGDRPAHTEALPAGWTKSHDHIICIYESRGHSTEEIIKRVRNLDPSLRGIISPAQIDKRLRQLDQIPEVDYWRRPYTSSPASAATKTLQTTSTTAASSATRATTHHEHPEGPSRYVRRWSRSDRPDPNAPPPPPSRSLAQIVEAHRAEESDRAKRGLGRSYGQRQRPHAITTNERRKNY